MRLWFGVGEEVRSSPPSSPASASTSAPASQRGAVGAQQRVGLRAAARRRRRVGRRGAAASASSARRATWRSALGACSGRERGMPKPSRLTRRRTLVGPHARRRASRRCRPCCGRAGRSAPRSAPKQRVEDELEVAQVLGEEVGVGRRRVAGAEAAPVEREHVAVVGQGVDDELERRGDVHPAVQHDQGRPVGARHASGRPIRAGGGAGRAPSTKTAARRAARRDRARDSSRHCKRGCRDSARGTAAPAPVRTIRACPIRRRRAFAIRAAEPRDVARHRPPDPRAWPSSRSSTHLVAGHAREAGAASVRPRPVAEALVAERDGARRRLRALLHQLLDLPRQARALPRRPVRRARSSAAAASARRCSTRLARLAAERGYGRFEWSVLDWNEGAIRFYQRMGATVMPDWRICRIAGAGAGGVRAIRRVAERGRPLRRAARRLSLAGAGATSTSPRSAAPAGRASAPDAVAIRFEHEDGRARRLQLRRARPRRRPARRGAARASASRRGDRVAIVLPQRFETAVAHIALYRLGAVAMPLSMLFGPDALEYRINDSEARLAIVDESGIANVLAARPLCPKLATVIAVGARRRAGRSRLDARCSRAERGAFGAGDDRRPTMPPS